MGSISYPSGSISQPSRSISNGAGSISSPSTGTISTETGASFVFTDASIPFDQRITFARSTVANRFNSAGTLTSTAIDVARANANQDYNPSTLAARGFLIEAGATNSLRNNTMAGAVAGSPGTAPTNWVTVVPTEITQTIVGTGTEDGIEYIDIRVNGTTTANRDYVVFVDGLTGSAASNGQLWTLSSFARLVGGSFSNVSLTQLNIRALDGGGSVLATFAQNTSFAPTSAALRTQRLAASGTIASASVATVRADMFFRAASGTTVDFTIRIGLPQLEQNAFATSPIKTSSAATARGADNAVISNLASIGFSATQGFVYCEFMMEGLGSTAFPSLLSFNDGTASNRITIRVLDGLTDTCSLLATAGGVQQASITDGAIVTANTLVKLAASWASGSWLLAANGVAATSANGASMPVVTQLQIGQQLGGNYLNGWLPKIQYGPQHLSQAQLNALTA